MSCWLIIDVHGDLSGSMSCWFLGNGTVESMYQDFTTLWEAIIAMEKQSHRRKWKKQTKQPSNIV
jgi:hypothetical protein